MIAKRRSLGGWWFVSLLLAASVAAASGDGRLVEAVKSKDSKTVELLLKGHAEVNARQADGGTALMWAAYGDDIETVGLLIQAGADVNAANENGVTSISLACGNGSAAVVKKLLEAGANPNVADRTGATPLMTCSRTGSEEAVNLLLAHGANMNATENSQGQTALMWAAGGRHSKSVEALIRHGADIHARSRGGFTPLLFAAQQGDLESARALLAAGADVNESTPQYGNTLVVAAAGGQEALAIFLLNNGADPNVADGNGITALHYAMRKGLLILAEYDYDAYNRPSPPNMPELAKALLAHGANPNAKIKKSISILRTGTLSASMVGATPFFLAAAGGDPEMMRVLADHGADPLVAASGNMTPLMMAASGGNPEIERTDEGQKSALEAANLALQLGADANAINAQGQTALHLAAYTGSDAIVQLLVDKGAKLDVRDKIGQTAWSMAEGISRDSADAAALTRHHQSTADLLLKLGAKQLSPLNFQSARSPGAANSYAAGVLIPNQPKPQEDPREKVNDVSPAQKTGDEKEPETKGDPAKGKQMFASTCNVCHDADTRETRVGPGLKDLFQWPPHTISDGTEHKQHTVEVIRKQIVQGGGMMPAVGASLSEQEIADLIAYLQTL